MKKFFWLLSLAFLTFTFFSLGRNKDATQEGNAFAEEYVPNEVLVKFKEDVGKYLIQGAIDSVQGKVITYLKKEIAASDWDSEIRSQRSFLADPYLLHLKVPESIDTEQAISILRLNPDVEYVEKNGIFRLTVIPNDDHFSKLWGMRNTGQTGGTSDADIDADAAWNIYTGSPGVTVAVTDSGIDYNHIDLQGNIWTNPGETGGGKETDGIDNDGNGYVDDWRGWDFYDGDNNPMDSYSHGTHVAGTIGAMGNNDEGVTGVCWSVKLMALRCGSSQSIDLDKAINAIDYAKNNNANVINASWGWYTYYQSLYDAINRARTKGKLFIAAAGNDQWNTDLIPHYPSSYNLDNIIAVLATDHNDNLSPFSNYGQYSVHIGSPGGTGDASSKDIYSTVLNNNYGFKAGTSMASPHTAGVAALAWGKCYQLTYSQLRTRIINKRDYLASLQDKCVANGRLNAYNVLYDASSPSAPSNLTATPTAWTVIRLRWTDNSNNEIGFEIQRKLSSQGTFSYIKSVDSNVTSYNDTTVVGATTYNFRVRAYNMAGNTSSNTVTVTIPNTVPAAPSNLYARPNPASPSGVNLFWNDNSNNEQAFIIERQTLGTGWWEIIGYSGFNSTSYTDTNVQAGQTYYYRVYAYNPNGGSDYSNEITVEIINP